MNAYELADDLEGWSDDWLSSGNKKNVFKKHAKMLRQQADRIAELEKELYFKNYYEELPDTPVGIYTTPQIKELSDEEILKIANYCSSATAWHGPDLDPIEFARAILKKASEK